MCATLCPEVRNMAKNLKLKAARAGHDLSQQELAELVGVSRQYNPTIKLCRAICRALGTTLNDLFWEENEE